MMEERLMQDKQGQDNRRQGRKLSFGWIVGGLAVSLAAAALYMACYGLFRSNAKQEYVNNPLETRDTADWLMAQTYVIYHDLKQSQGTGELSYPDIYVTPVQGCEWVLDKAAHNRYINEEAMESEVDAALPADRGRAYTYLDYLQNDYFGSLDEEFTQVNSSFDYLCEDLGTGASVSNLNAGSGIDPDAQYFYLSLVFDAYGNCKVENVICGEDPQLMRKLSSEAARNFSLESDPTYLEYDEAVLGVGLDTYFTLGGPVDCRVIYSISKEQWAKYEEGSALLQLHDVNYSLMDSHYIGYTTSGITNMLIILWLVVGILAILLPVSIKLTSGEPVKPVSKWLRLPAEVLYCLGVVCLSVGGGICFHLVCATLNGDAVDVLERVMPDQPQLPVLLLVYGANLLLLMAYFWGAWYIGVNLREFRRLGLWGYIKRHSLVYRFFPFIKTQVLKLYDTVAHFDVTRKANKLIIRLVLVNGIILFVISSLWFGGFGIAVVYSVLLYIVLRKYISDLQKKYGLLLHATNEIAEGNLNVQIKEDLGVFEPFKPQVYRIQNGFRKAVEEEVKSQRMKAELITNVSHDLKTPLTAIITYINLLKDENLDREQQKEYLDTLERKSLRLKVLIEDLFEVSKANSQSMTLNIMDVDIMNLIRQVAFEMEDKLAEQNLDLRLVLPEEKVVLPLDSQRTYRIYENLIGNIAKYAMPGTRVYVNGFHEEDRVVIILKNITAEEISVKPEELTDRFVRGDASRNTEGSGLGLAIAKSFTELQGGSLSVEVDGDLFKVTTVWKPQQS